MYFNIKNILASNGFGNKNDFQNIYINLYNSIKKAIIKRTLDEGLKLPPSRVLAKDLDISRSTVIKTYQLLTLEKYVNSIPGSGYYVASIKNKKIHNHIITKIAKGTYPSISKRGNSFRRNTQLNLNLTVNSIAFRPGLPPLDVFPVTQWKNLVNNYWKTVRFSELSYSNTIGVENLRQNISNYLKIYRNIDCEADQIIITTGSLHSLSLIGDALIDKKDELVIENPTYPHAYNLFDSLKAKICLAPIDDEGINVKNLNCKQPKIVYTTPSNQYPSGVKMSLKRRVELLDWASKKNSIIIEDDYDHEFSNWENPISSVFSLDNQSRVVYLGTFNKLLHPSIRIGYMIVPHFLLDTINALYQQTSRFVSPSLQESLSKFIEKDYLNKHLRNVIRVSIERKALFIKQFNASFDNSISIDSNNTGLHLIGNFDREINDQKLAKHLGNNGIIAHPYSNYFFGRNIKKGLVMGYCSVNNKLIKETIIRMKNEYKSFLNENEFRRS